MYIYLPVAIFRYLKLSLGLQIRADQAITDYTEASPLFLLYLWIFGYAGSLALINMTLRFWCPLKTFKVGLENTYIIYGLLNISDLQCFDEGQPGGFITD